MRKVSCSRQRFVGAAALFISVLLTGCGGGSSTPPPPPPTITFVSINTNSTLLRAGQQLQFTAVVRGTGNFSTALTWSVNGINGGDAVNGTISSSGAYTAPAALPPINPAKITATSVEDPTKSDSATLTIFTLTISPASATVIYTHTQQFTATATGVTNPVLVWSADHGTVDANGLYTPPSDTSQTTDTVHLNVQNAGSPPVNAAITLQVPTPVLTSITPNGASAFEAVAINGQDLVGVQKVFFPGPLGTTLAADFQAVSTSQVNATVPFATGSGPVYMTSEPTPGVKKTSNSIDFTRLPNVRIRASEKDLTPGEAVQFEYRLLGATSPSVVIWTTDHGSLNANGLYHAPVVTHELFATVTGCLQNTRSCDATMLRIAPLRIAPATPIVDMGQALQLNALEGSPVSADWSVLTGGGSVTSGGLFTAATDPSQAGGVPVSATAADGNSAISSIAVTGAFPGLVNRTNDYLNFAYDPKKQQYLQHLEGTSVQNAAVSGNRAYSLDLGVRFNASSTPPFSALEVYDITDPTNPVWLDATESAINLTTLFSVYSHYLFEVATSSFTPPSRVALYDVQANPPTLVSYAYTPDLATAFTNNGVIYGVPLNPNIVSTAPIYVVDITSGTIQQHEVDVTLPADANPGFAPVEAIGTGNVIYAGFGMKSGTGLTITTYDVSVSPPKLLGSTPLTGTFLNPLNMLIRGDLLIVGNVMLDISNQIPVQVGVVPAQSVQDLQGTTLLGRGTLPLYIGPGENYILVDVTNPSSPVTKTTFYDPPSGASGVLFGNGNYALVPDFLGGLATIDLSMPGGLIDKSRNGVFPNGYIFDHIISQRIMYVAGGSALGSGGLATFDLSSGTPVFSGILLYGQNVGVAVQVTGNTAFFGLLDSLKTVNVSDPTNPAETGSLALPTNSLLLAGNTLFDGTGDGRLVTLDVTNPNSLSILGSVPLPAPAVNLRLAGTTLFVADGPAGLLIFDVSNPAAPMQLSQLALSTPVWDVAISGTLAFLAADASGLVIGDISNLSQPKQISQTVLESWNPFPGQFDSGPRSVALSITVQNGLVDVGTANSAALVFSYDCSQATYPRLVSMNAFGEFIDSLISGFGFVGNDIYIFGAIGVETGIVQADNSLPRNAINLYYPPLTLRGPAFLAQPVLNKAKAFVHPKFDRKLFQRQHRYFETEKVQ